MRISARAIMFNNENDAVLLMYRKRTDENGKVKEYFVVPGGGVEENESLADAAKREVFEELGVEIGLLGYVGLETTPQGFSNYYHTEILSGKPALGGEEKEKQNENNIYEPMFIKIAELEKYNIFGVEYVLLAHECKYIELNNRILTDQGICPTCYNRQFDNVIFGDSSHMTLYEDELIEALFVNDPRKHGQVAIFSKKHYKDMLEIDEELLKHTFIFSQKLMRVLKTALSAESVYLVTMCDGPNNHFHVQLLPRYKNEERGSKNFVAERKKYVHDNELVKKIRDQLKN